jgi:peroxiredoxin
MLTPGDPAPDFALPDRDSNFVHLTDFRGQSVMLFNFSSW